MFDRTISICSAGKMFTATGYRVGWVYGPKDLVDKLKIVHETIVLNMPPFIQVSYSHEKKNEKNDFKLSDNY